MVLYQTELHRARRRGMGFEPMTTPLTAVCVWAPHGRAMLGETRERRGSDSRGLSRSRFFKSESRCASSWRNALLLSHRPLFARFPLGCGARVRADHAAASRPARCMIDDLFSLLSDLNGVQQAPKYHPEGDALFHSLQVFELALRATKDHVLWAAALFHDVGKAEAGADHAEVGADLLDGLLAPRAVWLVRHHLDLLRDARATRRRYQGTAALADLHALRRWDLGGRDPRARVMSLEAAFDTLFDGDTSMLDSREVYDPHAR